MKKPTDNQVTIVCGIIFLIAVLFVLVTDGTEKEKVKKEPNVDIEFVNKILDEVNNNYSVEITSYTGDKVFNYYTDGNVKLYETDKDYIIYNNESYILNEDMTVTKNKINDIVNDGYFDVNFIINTMNKCSYEYENTNNVKCNLKVTDYINAYNEKYNTSYDNFSADNITINVTYADNHLYMLKIDYTLANEKINDVNEKTFYNFKFSDIGKNDYKDVKSLFE